MSSEAHAIAASEKPITAARLVDDLRSLGLTTGDVVIVHSSLSALGWVAGGAQAVVQALLDVVGSDGTIVMPAQSGQLSDPAEWSAPAVPAEWIDMVREELPAFDADLTPTRQMGAIVDCFRQRRDTQRSSHPLVSFVASGPLSDAIVGHHPLEHAMDDATPLGRLYEFDARVLLLGVGHSNNTSLHLAEHRANWVGKRTRVDAAPMLVDGRREWVSYTDLDRDDDDFEQIGTAMAETNIETVGPVGIGSARLMSMRSVVDFATSWMTEHRPGSLSDQ